MGAMAGAFIAAAAAYEGDRMMSQGASATNAANIQVARTNNAFNARQAALQREFSAAQSARAMDFSAEMADTQMQRREIDLKKAGLNPALAYQLGGAAAPMGSVGGGSAASAAANPSLTNPAAAYGQIGSQVGTAVDQALKQSQLDNLRAQTTKTDAETNTVLPATVENIQAETGWTKERAVQTQRNVQMLDLALAPGGVTTGMPGDDSMFKENLANETGLNALKFAASQMTTQELQDTMWMAIKARNDQNFANSIEAKNISNASDGDFGKAMGYFNLLKPAINSAASLGSLATDAMLP